MNWGEIVVILKMRQKGKTKEGFTILNTKDFKKLWNEASILACPKTRAIGANWFYPKPENPCKDCNFTLCHNNGGIFDTRLFVPEKELTVSSGEARQ